MKNREAGAQGGSLDLWFDFASTYSYVSVMRIPALAEQAGVEVRWRPFLLGSIFKALGWPLDSPFNWQEAKGRHMWRDMERLCAEFDLRFTRPDPFPQNSLLGARVALTLRDTPAMPRFIRALFRAEFEAGKQIGDPAVIGAALAGLGVDVAATLARAGSDDIKGQLRTETETAQRLGVFGAPTFVTAAGELFWGNDRLEAALAWAQREAMDGEMVTSSAGESAR